MWRQLGKTIVIRGILQSRSFNSTRPINKRVSKIKLSELVLETESNNNKAPLTPLAHKELSTGSVVLDTVREYTKKYPLCVLLVQVGDFYEVKLFSSL